MVYLDHAATTPMLPEALEAYTATARTVGNASSLHAAGRGARRLVEEARERLAAAIGARPSEVVFTSGGTESDNLAVKGVFWARREDDPGRNRVIASAVEHHAVLDSVHWLAEREAADVTLLPVDEFGRVAPDALAAALDDDVAVVSVMWANNEVGALQPIGELAALAAVRGVPLHTDAVQAVGQVPVHFGASGVAALTLTGHKLGGPVGVGALLLGRDVACTPLLHGGGQERDVRSGTLDVPGIAAFAVAVELAVKNQQEYAARVGALRDELVRRVLEVVPDAIGNGPAADGVWTEERSDEGRRRLEGGGARASEGERQRLGPGVGDRLPGNAHFSFPGCEGDALLLLLDANDIACSTGSACSAGVAQPSHVLLAMGADTGRARSSLRFTLGHTSTRDDIDALVAALPAATERARRAGAIRTPRA